MYITNGMSKEAMQELGGWRSAGTRRLGNEITADWRKLRQEGRRLDGVRISQKVRGFVFTVLKLRLVLRFENEHIG